MSPPADADGRNQEAERQRKEWREGLKAHIQQQRAGAKQVRLIGCARGGWVCRSKLGVEGGAQGAHSAAFGGGAKQVDPPAVCKGAGCVAASKEWREGLKAHILQHRGEMRSRSVPREMVMGM